MKNLIILSLLLVFITSCSLERRLEKYCPLCTQKDSIVTITQIRDTTINIPGETVYIENTLFDTTVPQTLDIRVLWGSNNPTNKIYLESFVLTKIF
jgi:hypothetical protein